MSWELEVVSPVHIGCGSRAGAFEFLIDGEYAYYVPAEKLCEALSAEIGSVDRAVRALAAAFHQVRRDSRLTDMLEQIVPGRVPRIVDRLKQPGEHGGYRMPRAHGQFSEVMVHVKQEPDRPYVPGSSIKGAIRTAILYSLYEANEGFYQKHVAQRLESFWGTNRALYEEAARNDRGAKKRLSASFLCRFAPLKAFEAAALGGRGDVHSDVLRHLLVADTGSAKADEALALACVEVVGSDRKGELMHLWAEVLRPGTKLAWGGVQTEGEMPHASAASWQALIDHQGYNLQQACLASRWVLVRKYIQRFSSAVLVAEAEYWNQWYKPDEMSDKCWRRFEELRKAMAQRVERLRRLNSEEAPLLRVGGHEGLLSTTIALLVRQRDPELYQRAIAPATRGRAYPAFFPKTRRVVHMPGAEEPDVAGWVRLWPCSDGSASQA